MVSPSEATQASLVTQIASGEEGEGAAMTPSSEANTVMVSPITATISASALVEILNSVAGVVIPTGEKKQEVGGDGTAQLQLVRLMQEPEGAEPMQEEVQIKSAKPGRRPGSGKGKAAKQPWHYHLGGVRHCRVPLSSEIKEALEVAYISRIMSKNFRKEGQPEKERIAQVTGLEIEKVQEWFKNRRKKDKLIQSRINCTGTPKGKRGRKLLLPPHSLKKSPISEPNSDPTTTLENQGPEP